MIQKICFEWLKQNLAGKRKSQGIASLKMHEKHKKIQFLLQRLASIGSINCNEKCWNALQICVLSKQQMCEVLNSMWENFSMSHFTLSVLNKYLNFEIVLDHLVRHLSEYMCIFSRCGLDTISICIYRNRSIT